MTKIIFFTSLLLSTQVFAENYAKNVINKKTKKCTGVIVTVSSSYSVEDTIDEAEDAIYRCYDIAARETKRHAIGIQFHTLDGMSLFYQYDINGGRSFIKTAIGYHQSNGDYIPSKETIYRGSSDIGISLIKRPSARFYVTIGAHNQLVFNEFTEYRPIDPNDENTEFANFKRTDKKLETEFTTGVGITYGKNVRLNIEGGYVLARIAKTNYDRLETSSKSPYYINAGISVPFSIGRK